MVSVFLTPAHQGGTTALFDYLTQSPQYRPLMLQPPHDHERNKKVRVQG